MSIIYEYGHWLIFPFLHAYKMRAADFWANFILLDTMREAIFRPDDYCCYLSTFLYDDYAYIDDAYYIRDMTLNVTAIIFIGLHFKYMYIWLLHSWLISRSAHGRQLWFTLLPSLLERAGKNRWRHTSAFSFNFTLKCAPHCVVMII